MWNEITSGSTLPSATTSIGSTAVEWRPQRPPPRTETTESGSTGSVSGTTRVLKAQFESGPSSLGRQLDSTHFGLAARMSFASLFVASRILFRMAFTTSALSLLQRARRSPALHKSAMMSFFVLRVAPVFKEREAL